MHQSEIHICQWWDEILLITCGSGICVDDRSSRLQVSSRGPVVWAPGIPQCVGAQERQLATGLDHIACLLDPHVVAQVGDDSPVPLVDHSPRADLHGGVVALLAVAHDLCSDALVPVRLPLDRCCHVVGWIPGDGQLHQLHLLWLSLHDYQVRFLRRHCQIRRNGDAVDPEAFKVSIHLHSI